MIAAMSKAGPEYATVAPTTTTPTAVRNLPSGFESASWDKVPAAFLPAMREAFREKRFPVLLWGPPGRGKSYAAALLYSSIQGRAVWIRAVEFIRAIQTCRRDGSVVMPGALYECGESSLWKSRVISPDVLFVDDIGLRAPTESQYELLFELFDRREGKPTVYTSNLSPNQLAEIYDDRIASRICRGTRIEFGGADRRMESVKSIKLTNNTQ